MSTKYEIFLCSGTATLKIFFWKVKTNFYHIEKEMAKNVNEMGTEGEIYHWPKNSICIIDRASPAPYFYWHWKKNEIFLRFCVKQKLPDLSLEKMLTILSNLPSRCSCKIYRVPFYIKYPLRSFEITVFLSLDKSNHTS